MLFELSWRTAMRRHYLSKPTLRGLRAGEVDSGTVPEDRGWLKADLTKSKATPTCGVTVSRGGSQSNI